MPGGALVAPNPTCGVRRLGSTRLALHPRVAVLGLALLGLIAGCGSARPSNSALGAHQAPATSAPGLSRPQEPTAEPSASSPSSFRSGRWSPPYSIGSSNVGGEGAVSCAGTSFCVAATSSSENTYRFNGTSWSFWTNEQLDLSDTGFDGNLSLSCSSTSLCAAVYGDSDAQVFNGKSWSTPTPVGPNYSNGLYAVSCAGTSFCAALGPVTASIYRDQTWSEPQRIDPHQVQGLTAVSCPTTRFCVAADSAGEVMNYDGSAWSTPRRIISNALGIDALSCSSPTFCVAVSSHRAMTFDGRSWSAPVPIAINAGFQLESVSCPSSRFCMAVDNDGQAVTFDGSGWSGSIEIDRGAVAGEVFPGGVSISCPSPSICVAASSVDAFVWRSVS